MRFFIKKNLPSPVKFVLKTLVVFILSALLFFPTPVLALDYSGTLQSYVSNVKVELDSVLTAIKKLPNLSYENGKTTLAEIESKLQKTQTDARKNATDFQKLSNETQQEYNKINDDIKSLYITEEASQKQLDDLRERQRLKRAENEKKLLAWLIASDDSPNPLVIDGSYEEYDKYLQYVLSLNTQLKNLQLSRAELESKNQSLSEVIVLTNKISNLSDKVEKRIKLANQKYGNVKDYADALASFSDPDILGEISELDQLIADISKDL
ncbi:MULTISPECIES: hypothetical protein [unclassified Anabaena]|uniref:hypothetical protein n=1 Tax=unclassified Anabaena TaxID=2619674 RepID=UPI0014484BF2|nr:MULTISPECIES: hypothetical protein [unclassified Anabaena]MTJ09455.1 hypothetical protein [Anabaena sp. UHCC 0204]MTJ55401.1 hypothetical protein [Anabaena sp. UHCC 0253]